MSKQKKEQDIQDFFFATQTHKMTDDLCNALDMQVWTPQSPDWLLALAKLDGDEEFTVTGEQAKEIIRIAQEYLDQIVPPDYDQEDIDNANSDFEIIFNTFDDFTLFTKMADEDPNADIAGFIFGDKK